MKAIVIKSYGGPEVLEETDVPAPTLDPASKTDAESVIVDILAAGVNPVDYKVGRGDLASLLSLKFPSILGIDYAGTVAAVGSNVVGFSVGDAVYGKLAGINGHGTYAAQTKVHTKTDVILHRPASLSVEQAAGVGVVALTAYVGLVTYAGLSLTVADNAAKHVLVIGASGGVGTWAVKIAKLLGAKVTAVASGKNKSFVLDNLKADAFIDYTVAPLAEQLKTKDEFDVIYDAIGGDEGKNWDLAQLILNPHGLFVSPAAHLPEDTPVSLGAVAGFVGTMAWRAITNSRRYRYISSLPVDQFENIGKWLKDGKIVPYTSVVLPLSDVKKAHELSKAGRTVGKIVLTL
ncbi:NADPh quinone reductase [Physocladia obscura]|uniref:NADPh quinone reductase n=1 Tax=Physocladia obscura TaxID=109957 RepID=A0AAD5SPD0_9FUNG|nr:NADPh quinone reductase [Physocladia obscura]